MLDGDDKMNQGCKCCGSPYIEGKTKSYGFCRRPLCAEERTDWLKANWDAMPDNNRYRTKYEADFWQVTPEQKKQFSAFYALMRPAKRRNTKRKCLRCRVMIDNRYSTRDDYRICSQCHYRIEHIGALASV